MSKSVLFLYCLLSFIVSAGHAQNIKIDLNNPAPRVGSPINFKYSISDSSSTLQEKNSFSATELLSMFKSKIAHGTLEVSNDSVEPGQRCFGPFIFTIDDKEYKSETLCIEVFPKLPSERNGVWSLLVKRDKKFFLVTEQRVAGEAKQERTANSFSTTFSSSGVNFAELKKESFRKNQVQINLRYSSSSSKSVGESMDSFGNMVSYKLSVYEITLDEKYKNDLVLKKRDFKDWPDTVPFTPIAIKADFD